MACSGFCRGRRFDCRAGGNGFVLSIFGIRHDNSATWAVIRGIVVSDSEYRENKAIPGQPRAASATKAGTRHRLRRRAAVAGTVYGLDRNAPGRPVPVGGMERMARLDFSWRWPDGCPMSCRATSGARCTGRKSVVCADGCDTMHHAQHFPCKIAAAAKRCSGALAERAIDGYGDRARHARRDLASDGGLPESCAFATSRDGSLPKGRPTPRKRSPPTRIHPLDRRTPCLQSIQGRIIHSAHDTPLGHRVARSPDT